MKLNKKVTKGKILTKVEVIQEKAIPEKDLIEGFNKDSF